MECKSLHASLSTFESASSYRLRSHTYVVNLYEGLSRTYENSQLEGLRVTEDIPHEIYDSESYFASAKIRLVQNDFAMKSLTSVGR